MLSASDTEEEKSESPEPEAATVGEGLEEIAEILRGLLPLLGALTEAMQKLKPAAPVQITQPPATVKVEAHKPAKWHHEATFSDGRKVTMTSTPS